MRLLATMLVGVLIALLLVNSAATLYARVRAARSQTTLDQRWLPAQSESSHLLSAYVDEETGERGYLLTGDPAFLQPFIHGEGTAARVQRQLAMLVVSDAKSTTLLRKVVAAYDAWHRKSALPQIAARRSGPVPLAKLEASAIEGKALFDAVRARLARLSGRITALTKKELHSASSAQLLADVLTAVTVALALLAAALAFPVTRRVLTQPLEHLLAQLQRVGSGDYQQAIQGAGAAELVAMAQSAEQMRQSLLHHSDLLVRAQRTLTLRNERDRLAEDLHDRSIQRLFALGLSLSSLAKRHPEVAPALVPLIDETDRGIRELRGIIFNLSHDDETSLRHGIDNTVREAARALGFAPDLELHGPLDHIADQELTHEVLAVLREALSNVVRHARASAVQVTVGLEGHDLHLRVADDGVGISGGEGGHGIRNMEARAERRGGRFEVRSGDAGTVVEWQVPLDLGQSELSGAAP